MTENNTPQKQEFDMLASILGFFGSIKRACIRLFKAIVNALIWLVNSIIRHFIIWVGVIIICFVLAYLKRPDSRYTMSGEVLVECNGFNIFILDKNVTNLNHRIASRQIARLAQQLGIDEALCGNLLSVEMGVAYDSDNNGYPNEIKYNDKFAPDTYEKGEVLDTKEKGEILYKEPIMLKMPRMASLKITTNPIGMDEFIQLSQAVIKYFDQSQVLRNQYQLHIEQMESERDLQLAQMQSLIRMQEGTKLNQELSKEESYMVAMMSSCKNLSLDDVRKIFQQQGLYTKDISDNIKHISELQTQIDKARQPLTVLSEISPVSQAYHPSWKKTPAILSVVLSIVLCLLLDYRKEIITYIRQQRKK